MPGGTSRILDRRTLADSQRRLAALLRPGMRVLDVGCATGAITADMADAVGPNGLAVGSDINEALLTQACARRRSRPHLQFVRADVYHLPFGRSFDVVTAARMVQWLSRPAEAVAAMAGAVRPGGVLLVLDYDHEAIEWTPRPPASMAAFYDAFLAWRATAGFDNRIARRLPSLLARAGATSIQVVPQPELTRRGEPDFQERACIWADVAATRGHQMVADGFVSESGRMTAEEEYRAWVEREAESMTLHLDAVEGVVP